MVSNQSVKHNKIKSRECFSLPNDKINHDDSTSNDDTVTHDNTISHDDTYVLKEDLKQQQSA